MDQCHAQRNVLFGILALKLGCIDRDALVSGLRDWMSRPDRSLEQVLCDRGALTGAKSLLIAEALEDYLAAHDDDPGLGLAEVQSPVALRTELSPIADPALRAALDLLNESPTAIDDPFATVADSFATVADRPADTIADRPAETVADAFATQYDPALATHPNDPDPFATRPLEPGPSTVLSPTAVNTPETVTAVGCPSGVQADAPTLLGSGPSPLPPGEGGRRPGEGESDARAAVTLPLTRPLRGHPLPGGEGGKTTGPDRAFHIRYRTLRPHAKGGLGEVFVALDEELGREVALKEIQGKYADRTESRSRFLLEAEVTGGLEHPGIVPVYGLGQYPDGRPYYAMRFIRGESLHDAINAFHQKALPLPKGEREGVPGPTDQEPPSIPPPKGGKAERIDTQRDPGQRALELRQLLNRFLDVCNAIGYAHARGILHRDIKPANVMLGTFGETLVVDWGVAKALDRPEADGESDLKQLRPLSGGGNSETLFGSTIGTPHYMSPEQAAGRLDLLGPASDIYSLGATLYCLLAGRTPFTEPKLAPLLEKVKKGDFPPPRAVNHAIPPALNAVCLKAMALRPEDRYPTTRALADDIEHWLADEPVSVYREPWTARLARWAKRHKTLVTTTGTLLVVSVAGLSAFSVLMHREEMKTHANYVLARSAVEEMLTKLGKVELTDVPRMEEVRESMLAKALTFYQTFLREHGDDRALVEETGRAATSLGDILEMLGKYPDAEAAYRKAVALLAPEARGASSPAEYRRNLADAWQGLGVLLKKESRSSEAESALTEARALRGKLADQFPENPEIQQEKNDTVYQLGTLLARTPGRQQDVEKAYATAIEAEKKLASAYPNDLEYARKLARYHNNRGMLYRFTDIKAAEGEFQEALRIHQGLTEKYGMVPAYQWELARSLSNVGAMAEFHRAYQTAADDYRKAIGRLERLAEDFPKVPDYRYELAAVRSNLGMVLWKSGQNEGALDNLNQAVALYQALATDPKYAGRPDYQEKLARTRRQLAIVLNQVGKKDEAIAALETARQAMEALVAAYPNVPEYHTVLGLVLDTLARIKIFMPGQDGAVRPLLDAAIREHDRAVKASPKNVVFRQYLATTFDYLGASLERDNARPGAERADEAAQAAQQLLRLMPDEPVAHFVAARLYAVAAVLVTQDTRHISTQEERIKTYSDRALKEVTQAVHQGFGTPAQLADPIFAPIKGREEFQKLIKELQEKNAAGGLVSG